MEEVKKAYKRLVKRWHPDQYADHAAKQQIAQEKLKEINVAYTEALQCLRSPLKETPSQPNVVNETLKSRQTASDDVSNRWRTAISRFRSNLNWARKFFSAQDKEGIKDQNISTPVERSRTKNRPDAYSRPTNFETIFQKSLSRRSGNSSTIQGTIPPRNERKKMNLRSKSYYAAADVKRRHKRGGKGRVESIRPIAKIRRVDRIN